MGLYFENRLRKETKIQKQILDLLFLFTIKNVAFGHTFCHLENCFFLLYVCFKVATRKRVVFPINWNIEKNITLNTKGTKRGTKRNNTKMA